MSMPDAGRPGTRTAPTARAGAKAAKGSKGPKVTVPTSELAGGYAAYACSVDTWTRVRDDHHEGVDGAGRKVVRAYGFRNVQRIVGQLRRKKEQPHFIEIMACPGGCPNGGGMPQREGSVAAQAEQAPVSTAARAGLPEDHTWWSTVAGLVGQVAAWRAEWRSIKVDSEGKAVVTASSLKW